MAATTEIDRRHLARAIDLAQGGFGRVTSEPAGRRRDRRHGRGPGEGYHRALGGPHAEVEAIRAAGDAI